MKKLVIIFFITAVMFSGDMIGNIQAADKPGLTLEYLASNTWGPFNGSGVKVRFSHNGQFEMIDDNSMQNCEEYKQGSGKYTMKGNKVILTFENFPREHGSPQCTSFQKGDSIEGILTDKDQLKYKWMLYFRESELSLYNHNTSTTDGDIIKINNIEAVSTGSKDGETTAVLKVREAPGVSYKEKVFLCEYSYGDETVKALDKGKTLTIFARTKEKYTVGKMNNYWYYVKFNAATKTYDECPQEGWVFGEFVKKK